MSSPYFFGAAVGGFLLMTAVGVPALVALCSSIPLAKRRKTEPPGFDLKRAYHRITHLVVLAAVMMTIRGTYYATTDEIQIPIVMSGAAAGILSIVGNTPDLFIFTLYGYFMDAYPGIQGYRYIFIAMMVFAVLGVGCCFLLAHMKKKIK